MNKFPLSKEEQKTLETYEKVAGKWVKSHSGLEGLADFWRPEFKKFQDLLSQGRVIDIGCGGGRDALLFQESTYKYTGIDISKNLLFQAKKLVPGLDFHWMSMYFVKIS